MMTVEELIEKLQKYPPYYRVCIQQNGTRYVESAEESTDSGERVVELSLSRG